MISVAPEEFARRADVAERSGLRGEADAAWDALIEHYPTHPLALFARGRRLIERGDPAGALDLLRQAEAGHATLAEIPFYAALGYRVVGDLQGALAALDRALAIDPYFFMALLSKAVLIERLGNRRLAARTYRNALKIAPAPERLSPSQREMLIHARAVVSANSEAVADHLRAATAELRGEFSGERLERFDQCLEILAGVKQREVQDPLLLYFPRLPAIPFYDRELFPWLPDLEAATGTIRSELEVVLSEDWDRFAPYMQLPKEAPVNQWAELNHSPRWSTFTFWSDGVRNDTNCARCPKTTAVLESLPLARQPGFAPTAVFSVLSPRTRIPPHTGSTNTRLLTHLPLILPPNCGFRVGNDTRQWEMGEAWVFDDSMDHEAWNDSDETRTILIFDVWNPLLTKAERALVSQMMVALNEFNAAIDG